VLKPDIHLSTAPPLPSLNHIHDTNVSPNGELLTEERGWRPTSKSTITGMPGMAR